MRVALFFASNTREQISIFPLKPCEHKYSLSVTICCTKKNTVLDSITKSNCIRSIHCAITVLFSRRKDLPYWFPFFFLECLDRAHWSLLVKRVSYLMTHGLHPVPWICLTGNVVSLITEKQHMSIWGLWPVSPFIISITGLCCWKQDY